MNLLIEPSPAVDLVFNIVTGLVIVVFLIAMGYVIRYLFLKEEKK